MCLAVPGKILEMRDDAQAAVDMMGATRSVSVRLTPDAKVGDFVLVHAGFAIEVIDAEQARETIEVLRDLEELEAEELAGAGAMTAAVPAGAEA